VDDTVSSGHRASAPISAGQLHRRPFISKGEKTMTTYEIIQALIASGHSVDYYVRPAEKGYGNQGYRITRVDSQLFATSDAEGNNYARAMLTPKFGKKAKLTIKQKTQRKKANPMTGLPKLTKKQTAFMRKANRKLKQHEKAGHYTAKSLRNRKKALGWKETAKSVRNAVLHYNGVAYRSGVLAFIDVIDSGQVMQNTSDYLKRTINSTNEAALADAWQFWYDAKNKKLTWAQADESALSRLKEGHDSLIK